jgi:hypothetical protein
MSAFYVSKKTIDCIITTAIVGASDSEPGWYPAHLGAQQIDLFNASRIGAVLWNENLISILYRYPRDKSSDYDAPEDYKFQTQPKVSTAQAIKLIDCYAYQSCEHDGWETSASAKFCNELRGQLTSKMPGYDAAQWGV